MAEMSNHSYHYNRNLLISLPFDPSMDLFDSLSLLPDNEPDQLPSPNDDTEETTSTKKDKKGNAKKKPRRKRRNLTGVSKQRRAANERERKRLQIINTAFKDLKEILPLFPNENNISKIEIVRLAATTIKYLSDMLNKNVNNNLNNIDNTRSPGGSEASEQSEGSSISNDSTFPDFEGEAKIIDTKDIDISNLLFNIEELNTIANECLPPSMVEIKAEEVSSYRSCFSSSTKSSSSQHCSTSSSTSSSSSSSYSSTSDGFSGFDINMFLHDSDSESSKDNDVFPSMISLW